MHYMMLFYETPEDFGLRSSGDREAHYGAWRAYHRDLVEAGIYVTGAPLQDESTATTIRVRAGQRLVQDGPFADTKEQLGGAIIVDLPSLDAALEWAARCPTARTGAVEVRPVSDEVREAVECPGD